MTSDKIKTVSCLSLVTYHLSLPLNVSAGQLFELMLPASFALTALASAWVLASARRHRFGAAAVTLWTLGTLFFPLIILPLYLIARSARRRRERESVKRESDDDNPADESSAVQQPSLPLRRALPLLYLLVMMGLAGLYFYMDWRSVEAHLARANQARVEGRRERVIAEYRAALQIEDDAHTHNLLGKELAAAQRYEEALPEFRTAERMGELDEELAFNIAVSLDQLNREAEAKAEFERFLNGPLCREMPYDARCEGSRQRLAVMAGSGAR